MTTAIYSVETDVPSERQANIDRRGCAYRRRTVEVQKARGINRAGVARISIQIFTAHHHAPPRLDHLHHRSNVQWALRHRRGMIDRGERCIRLTRTELHGYQRLGYKYSLSRRNATRASARKWVIRSSASPMRRVFAFRYSSFFVRRSLARFQLIVRLSLDARSLPAYNSLFVRSFARSSLAVRLLPPAVRRAHCGSQLITAQR